MKSILDTSLYAFYRHSSVIDLKEFIVQYNPKLDNAELSSLEEQLNRINKRFVYPMKTSIMQATLVDNTIIPLYNMSRIYLPSFIPAVLKQVDGKVCSLVNLTKIVLKEDKVNKTLDIDPIKLYAMLQAGYIMLVCKKCERSLEINQDVLLYGSTAYSTLVSKVLDKMYALNLNTSRADKVKFLCALFFLCAMMDKLNIRNDNVINLAMKSTSMEFTEREAVNIIQEIDDTKALYNLSGFFDYLNTIEGLGSLNLRGFLQEYARMYGQNTIFSLEYAPYFFWTIFNVAITSNMNNQFIIDPLLGKMIDKLFVAFSNVAR